MITYPSGLNIASRICKMARSAATSLGPQSWAQPIPISTPPLSAQPIGFLEVYTLPRIDLIVRFGSEADIRPVAGHVG